MPRKGEKMTPEALARWASNNRPASGIPASGIPAGGAGHGGPAWQDPDPKVLVPNAAAAICERDAKGRYVATERGKRRQEVSDRAFEALARDLDDLTAIAEPTLFVREQLRKTAVDIMNRAEGAPKQSGDFNLNDLSGLTDEQLDQQLEQARRRRALAVGNGEGTPGEPPPPVPPLPR